MVTGMCMWLCMERERQHTHICKHRRGPSSIWVKSSIHSMWGCCTVWTWRRGRCAPPPAGGNTGSHKDASSQNQTLAIAFSVFKWLKTWIVFDAQRLLTLSWADLICPYWMNVFKKHQRNLQCRRPFFFSSCVQLWAFAVNRTTMSKMYYYI